MKSKTLYAFGAAMTGLFLLGTAAQAADRIETIIVPGSSFHSNDRDFRSQRVSYADLDLSRTRDYQRLQMRISSTAGRLCDAVKGSERWNLMQRQTCINTSVLGAMAQVPAHSPKRVAVAYVTPLFED